MEVRYLSPVVGFMACDLVGVEVRLFGLDDASILCKRVCSSRTCECIALILNRKQISLLDIQHITK